MLPRETPYKFISMIKKFRTRKLKVSPYSGQPCTVYTYLEVVGLSGIYYKLGGKLQPCDGAVALLIPKISDYDEDKMKGYLQLFYSHTEKPDPGYEEVVMTFTPAYTKEGKKILIKAKQEVPFLIFNSDEGYTHDSDGHLVKREKKGYLSYKTKGWNS